MMMYLAIFLFLIITAAVVKTTAADRIRDKIIEKLNRNSVHINFKKLILYKANSDNDTKESNEASEIIAIDNKYSILEVYKSAISDVILRDEGNFEELTYSELGQLNFFSDFNVDNSDDIISFIEILKYKLEENHLMNETLNKELSELAEIGKLAGFLVVSEFYMKLVGLICPPNRAKQAT
jgi:hypothetical protein